MRKGPSTKALASPPEEQFVRKVPLRVKGIKTRERLMFHAAELFAEYGYMHVDLDKISAAAKVTKGCMYWHFKNKRHLYEECIKNAIHMAYVNTGHLVDATEPDKRIRQYLEWIMAAMSYSLVTRRLILRVIADRDIPLMKILMNDQLGVSHVTLMQILKDLKISHDRTALAIVIYSIATVNEELLEISQAWDPNIKKRVGGKKTIRYMENIIKSW